MPFPNRAIRWMSRKAAKRENRRAGRSDSPVRMNSVAVLLFSISLLRGKRTRGEEMATGPCDDRQYVEDLSKQVDDNQVPWK